MKNGITLQINSLEALEKVIGGSSEVEVDIRNNIVQKFAEKHLKAIASQEVMNTAVNAIKVAVDGKVREIITKEVGAYQNPGAWTKSAVILSGDFEKAVSTHIEKAITDLISDKVTEAIEKFCGEDLQGKIDRSFAIRADKEVERRVQEKLDSIRKSL